ncbi:MAG: cephalosporin hydroxylase [Alphaproteobacteria bacterium]|nr:cephalosporin hydroxylase [Alphaproteobacteria bacterium]
MSAQNLNPVAAFEQEREDRILSHREDKEWRALSNDWMRHAAQKHYMYNFSFLGRPIIQLPQDMVAFQEIVWDVKPDLIIEMGIAHGGSLIMSAGMLALLDYCDAVAAGKPLDPKAPGRKVIGVDIDIRAHNRAEIEAHPMAHKIEMVQGSSIDAEIIAKVKEMAKGYKRVLVSLDSNHTHDHVLAELQAYAPLTSKGSYCIVFDTIVEDLPDGLYPNRPWSRGNNPKTAVHEYLKSLKENPQKGEDGQTLDFSIDSAIDEKLLLTVTPDGFLKRV